MRKASVVVSSLLAFVLVGGCDGASDPAGEGAAAKAATGNAGAPDPAGGETKDHANDEAEDERKVRRRDEDRGTAQLTLGDGGDGGEVWNAKRATARHKDDGKLRISASVQSSSGERTSRRQLTLYINDYKGPGKYVVTNMTSSLTAVTLGLGKIKKAEAAGGKAQSDAAATEAVVDGMKGASVLLLKDAKVEITQANDAFIDGSITWSGVALNGPGKLSGTFHARVKHSKK